MNSDLRGALSQWNAEVEAEAARLVRVGYGPWAAMSQAATNVGRRRERKAAEHLREQIARQSREEP